MEFRLEGEPERLGDVVKLRWIAASTYSCSAPTV